MTAAGQLRVYSKGSERRKEYRDNICRLTVHRAEGTDKACSTG